MTVCDVISRQINTPLLLKGQFNKHIKSAASTERPSNFMRQYITGWVKRPWNADIKAIYKQLVNSVVNTYSKQIAPQSEGEKSSYLALAGARGSRTHHPSRRTAANGFEVRGDHQAPSAPKITKHQEK